MVLSEEELKQAEGHILSILDEATEPLSAPTLFARLENVGVPQFLARAAIWYLIDRDKVKLTRDLLLGPAGESRRSANLQALSAT